MLYSLGTGKVAKLTGERITHGPILLGRDALCIRNVRPECPDWSALQKHDELRGEK